MRTNIIILTISAFFFFKQSSAQSPLPKGKTQLNVGLGFSDFGVPFYFGLDHAVGNDFTLGGEFSYRGYKESWRGNHYKHNIAGLAMNGNYHFNRIMNIRPDWDFYAGLNIGFFFWNSPEPYNGPYTSGLGLGAQVGGRYYFSKNAGVNLEFGSGNAFSGGKIGFTFKL